METQVQKYNGNNPHNNQVVVDYEKREVKFKPVRGELHPYLVLLFGMIIKFTMKLLVLIFLLTLILYGIEGLGFISFPNEGMDQVTLLSFLLGSLSMFLVSLKYFDKEWLKNEFPKFNYHRLKDSSIPFLKSNVERLEINKKNICDKQVIIPSFDNIMLSYKCFGDFNKFLKKIVIRNHFDKKAHTWYCIFQFSKEPVKGKMVVKYL